MKKCNSCQQTFENDGTFCPYCGSNEVQELENKSECADVICPKCNSILNEDNILFCPNCGTSIKNNTVDKKANIQNGIKDAVNKVKDNEFVKSVKQDLGNSQSINMIKGKAKETANKVKSADINKKKKITTISIIIAVVIVILFIVTHIHQCEECDKVYFGNKHTISFWGETENVCKDCYNDFYGWE
jgi:uncharacterized Zn finger protein (UPF0148 family)